MVTEEDAPARCLLMRPVVIAAAPNGVSGGFVSVREGGA